MADPDTPRTSEPDTPETDESREARSVGERTDLGQTPDALSDTLDQSHLDRALTGSDSGSDTRAGSLQGGSATGSDIDPDSEAINARLARSGSASRSPDKG